MANKFAHVEKPKLKRSLTLFDATIYAIGVIFGAGIYALIGEAAGVAGNATWLSFVFAAIIASLTMLSYAELSSLFPRSAAAFFYTLNAFRSEFLAFAVGYLSLMTTMVAIATVSLGFGGYFSAILSAPVVETAIALIIVFSIVNFIGIKQSAKLNAVLTAVEAGGLLLILLLGAQHLGAVDYFAVPSADVSLGLLGMLAPILAGTTLIFFAYLGFEDVVNIAEETIEPRKTIPRAIIIGLAFTTIIYILVAMVAVSAVPYQELAESKAPLALVAERSFPGTSLVLAFAALFATANTVLIMLIVASRVLYGMASDGALPKFLAGINPLTRTPQYAILITALISVAFVLSGSIKTVALLTDFGVFIIFFMVNASLVRLRFTMPNARRVFKAPLSIGKVSITGVLGAAFCLGMLLQFMSPVEFLGLEMPLFVFGLIAVALSVPLYLIIRPQKSKLLQNPAFWQ